MLKVNFNKILDSIVFFYDKFDLYIVVCYYVYWNMVYFIGKIIVIFIIINILNKIID